MDDKTHKLFAQVLLEATEENNTSSSWGIAPDIDMKFLHRWRRHRISVLPEIYKENYSNVNNVKDIDKDAITLCIVSHFYLDIFNAWVFPFGLLHPIYPENTIIKDVLNDIGNVKLLIEDLKNLSGLMTFNKMFYAESKGIMQEFVNNLNEKYIPSITEIIVRRLAMHAETHYDTIYKKAMNDIYKFTENDIYNHMKENKQAIDVCERFEIEYACLINKASIINE